MIRGGSLNYRKKIISPEEAESYIEKGWKKADLHWHTSVSYDVPDRPWLSPTELYNRAKELGLSYITITDHDVIDAPNFLPNDETIVPGAEIKIRDSEQTLHTIHVNVYCLNNEHLENLLDIANSKLPQRLNHPTNVDFVKAMQSTRQHYGEGDFQEFIQYLRNNNLPHTFNHPYWFETSEEQTVTRENFQAIDRIAEEFPIIEYNTKRPKRLNALAVALASRHGKGMTCSTDSHTGNIGDAYTLAPGDTFREFFDNISMGNYRLVAKDFDTCSFNNEVKNWVKNYLHPGEPGALIETGHPLADRLLTYLSKPSKSAKALRGFIENAVRGITEIGIPARVYLGRQNKLADRIEASLGSTL